MAQALEGAKIAALENAGLTIPKLTHLAEAVPAADLLQAHRTQALDIRSAEVTAYSKALTDLTCFDTLLAVREVEAMCCWPVSGHSTNPDIVEFRRGIDVANHTAWMAISLDWRAVLRAPARPFTPASVPRPSDPCSTQIVPPAPREAPPTPHAGSRSCTSRASARRGAVSPR